MYIVRSQPYIIDDDDNDGAGKFFPKAHRRPSGLRTRVNTLYFFIESETLKKKTTPKSRNSRGRNSDEERGSSSSRKTAADFEETAMLACESAYTLYVVITTSLKLVD